MDKQQNQITITVNHKMYENFVLFKNLKPEACFISRGYYGDGEYWWLGKDEYTKRLTEEAELLKLELHQTEFSLEEANKKIADLEKQLKEKRKWWKIK